MKKYKTKIVSLRTLQKEKAKNYILEFENFNQKKMIAREMTYCIIYLIRELYQFVLLLVMIGLILGVGIIVLDKFAATPLVVTIAVLVIIVGLVIRGFGAAQVR